MRLRDQDTKLRLTWLVSIAALFTGLPTGAADRGRVSNVRVACHWHLALRIEARHCADCETAVHLTDRPRGVETCRITLSLLHEKSVSVTMYAWKGEELGSTTSPWGS